MDIVGCDEVVVLVYYARGALLELLCVFRSPPVFEIALRIELPTFIVEGMGELMADDAAGIAVIHRVVHVVVIVGRLKNSGGKVDVVHLRVVVGVYGWRGHAPFTTVDRLPNLADLSMRFELSAANKVTQSIAACDLVVAVVAPLVGVADFVDDGMQLIQRALRNQTS